MTTFADTPEPSLLWNFFRELSQIPRESKNEDKAVEWVVSVGQALGCEVELERVGPADRPHFANVLLRKTATPGRVGRPVTALQAHIDMVAVKSEGSQHDFECDPIALVFEGDRVRANGTTLGADNGIGVCAALATLADTTLEHGPIEVLITVDEESGMTGVRELKPGWLKATYLLNLDSEVEGEATISCAGALETLAKRKIERSHIRSGRSHLRIEIGGLPGGHSGLEIAEGRANALKILSRIMSEIMSQAVIEISDISGGSKRNAIPANASADFLCDTADEKRIMDIVERCAASQRSALPPVNEGLTVSCLRGQGLDSVMSEADGCALVGVLNDLPHGVEAMSGAVPGLVETSTNLAVVKASGSEIEIEILSRSAIDANKGHLGVKIKDVLTQHGFVISEGNEYPGWQPAPESDLVNLVKQTHSQVFGSPIKIVAIHAGLECGLIGQHYPNLKMISFGPNIWEVHTPNEHTSIKSVANFWRLLRSLLERI